MSNDGTVFFIFPPRVRNEQQSFTWISEQTRGSPRTHTRAADEPHPRQPDREQQRARRLRDGQRQKLGVGGYESVRGPLGRVVQTTLASQRRELEIGAGRRCRDTVEQVE